MVANELHNATCTFMCSTVIHVHVDGGHCTELICVTWMSFLVTKQIRPLFLTNNGLRVRFRAPSIQSLTPISLISQQIVSPVDLHVTAVGVSCASHCFLSACEDEPGTRSSQFVVYCCGQSCVS